MKHKLLYIVIVFFELKCKLCFATKLSDLHVRQQNRRCECSIRWIGIRRIRKVSHIEAVIPFLQRLLRVGCTRSSAKSLRTTLVRQHYGSILDMYDRGVLFYIRIYFGRFLLGTATVLSKDETMKAAQKAVYKNPVPSKSSRTPCPRSQAERVSKRRNHPLISTTSCYLVIEQVFSKSTMLMDLVFNTFVRGVPQRKSCTMTSQDSWMFRASAAILGIACTSTQSPLSSTDLL
jgi:hypothetical protein